MTEEEAREALTNWTAQHKQRDTLVREAAAAGVTKHQVHQITGLARTTIDSILGPRTDRRTAMITAISDSDTLAAVLNAEPLTAEDAAETPRDWIAGIWVNGTVYPLDPDATTETLAVLADGTAAVRRTQPGEFCGYPRHNHYKAHWCPADIDTVHWGEARGIDRDWRKVYVWDANGYTDTTVYPTVDEAKAAFTSEEAELDEIGEDDEFEDPDEDDDEEALIEQAIETGEQR